MAAADGITKDGGVAVSGLEEGASWEFSTDGGTTWAAGTGTSIALAAGTYAAGTVQVKDLRASTQVELPVGEVAAAIQAALRG